jgi:thioredoxin reductase (NADPH)
MNNLYDSIVIGASAAGMSAGIYLKRQNLNFLILAKDIGGEMALSGIIENYPGFPLTNGVELTQKFKEHLEKYEIEPVMEEVVKIEQLPGFKPDKLPGYKPDMSPGLEPDKSGNHPGNKSEKNPGNNNPYKSVFKIITSKNEYLSKTIIIATGSNPKKLNVPGEKEFYHKGVSYCSVCDMPLFPKKIVAIIGGGNSALESGILASKICQKAYIINKNPKFKGDKVLFEEVSKKENVEIIYNALTQEIYGDEFVKGIKYLDQNTGEIKDLKVDGVFIHIGLKPNTDFVPDEWQIKNEYGEIIVNELCQTKIPGIFAAGDVTSIPHKQIGIAVGQGIIAALEVVRYLNSSIK